MCNVGYDLFTEDGVSGFHVPASETGLRDGDSFRFNKTCVPKSCAPLPAPEHGRIAVGGQRTMQRFGDLVHFKCDFGYLMEGASALLCTSTGEWNGTIPTCVCKCSIQLIILCCNSRTLWTIVSSDHNCFSLFCSRSMCSKLQTYSHH
jgi:hypothetical protein